MFGNLFDSEPGSSSFGVLEDYSPVVTVAGLQAPASPRPACGLCGLQNQGATCYLNTLIQTLLYTPEFRESLLSIPLSELQGSPNSDCPPLPGHPNAEGSAQVKERVIPLQLQRLFARLLLLDSNVVSTNELTRSFGWKEQEELQQQQDVQELHRILFAALERSLVGTSGSELVKKLHRGTLLNQVQCLQCKNVSKSLEEFLDLTLIVSKEATSLEQSLSLSFLEYENMKGNNQYFCSHCKKSVDAQKSSKINLLPPILTFSLLRFNYDFVKGCRYKETGDFSFPMELDMGAFCCQAPGSASTRYELFSVIIHSGSTYGGHYHAYIKDIECLGFWNPPPTEVFEEDNSVSESDSKEKDPHSMKADPFSKPEFVLAAILALQPTKGMPIENLSSELVSHIGLSWNKRFKKFYGPLVKFLLKNDKLFTVNKDVNQVFLKNGLPTVNGTADSQDSSSQSMDSVCEAPDSSHWFDFDDSQVRAIRAEDIPKRFGGQESAYMLCYRSVSLVRPFQAMGNTVYAVPDHLLTMVVDENAQMLKEREEYEHSINSIQLNIVFGACYRQHQGALQPIKEIPNLQLTVDQRKPLQHLRELIFTESSQQCGRKDFTLHQTLQVPAGVHLVRELTPDHDGSSLVDLKISSLDQLFVSYGKQVLGVLVGMENIPILLSFSCHLPDGSSHDLEWAFAKSMSIAEVKLSLSSLIPSLKLPICICPSLSKGFSGMEAGFPDDMTLGRLNLLDGDQLLVWETRADLRYIRVDIYNRIAQASQMTKDVDCPCKSISMEKDLDILSVKAETLLRLGLPLDRSTDVRLRKISDFEESWKQPPLYDCQRLEEIFPECSLCSLVLEEGPPPAPNELTLYWSIGVGSMPHFNANFTLDCSVEQCLERICSISGVQGLGKCWHLSLSNWLGEPMKNCGLEGNTLEGLQHGDLLYLQEGPPAPLAFLSLQIRLYPTPECLLPPSTSSNAAVLRSQCKEIERILKDQWDNFRQVFMPLGQVELPVTCTLGELKKQILTLSPLSSLHIPSALHLRLRPWQKKTMTKTLRGHSQTLGRLKICNQQILCAELLEHEEDLMPNDIPLNVIPHQPGNHLYSSLVQFIWAAGKKAPSKSLLASLASAFHLNPRNLVVEKFCSEEDRWQLLAAGEGCAVDFALKQQVKKNKMNLRQPPFFLTEGDTVRIKDKAQDSEKRDDYSKEIKLSKLEPPQGKDQNSFSSMAKQLENGEFEVKKVVVPAKVEVQRPPNPEVGISIHVDDFS